MNISTRISGSVICPIILIMAAPSGFGLTTNYVDLTSSTPVAPYTNWITAATNIQSAIDVADDGNWVLVSNGTYLITSEIVVEKDIVVASVSGPEVTIIDGAGLCRGFNLGSNSCVISGFTITNGYTRYDGTPETQEQGAGGGVYCLSQDPLITECLITDNKAEYASGVKSGTLRNCIIFNNEPAAKYDTGCGVVDSIAFDCIISNNAGGGMIRGEAYNCTISENGQEWRFSCGGLTHGYASNCVIRGNYSGSGGGMSGGKAIDCLILNNYADFENGGGLYDCDAYNCIIEGNFARHSGGGMSGGSATNCIIRNNDAFRTCGGLNGTTAYRCIISDNSGEWVGGAGYAIIDQCLVVSNRGGIVGGLLDCETYNCTVVENLGGGISSRGSYTYNSIVYYNSVMQVSNMDDIFSSCIGGIDPMTPPDANGNIYLDPGLMSRTNQNFRLNTTSPCINAASNVFVRSDIDLDGNPRIGDFLVDMGVYEYQGVLDADSDGMSDGFERYYFNDPTNAVATEYGDADPHDNLSEYIAGTDPTRTFSVFRVTDYDYPDRACFIVTWDSVPGRYYSVVCSTNLESGFQTLEYNLEYPCGSYTDTCHAAETACFYGLRVRTSAEPVDPPPEMVAVPAGINNGTDPDFGAYELVLDFFYMDPTEVSKAQWDTVHDWAVTNGYEFSNTGGAKGLDHPVNSVNWYDCAKWCNARSEHEGRMPCYRVQGAIFRQDEAEAVCDFGASGYRLPTVDEWVYAARGGLSGTRFPWGGLINHDHANYRANSSLYTYDNSPYLSDTYHPIYEVNNQPFTSPAGSFSPNEFGLYDLAGNVWEWCDDIFDGQRGMLGGSYGSHCNWLRCGALNYDAPETSYIGLGFRSVFQP